MTLLCWLLGHDPKGPLEQLRLTVETQHPSLQPEIYRCGRCGKRIRFDLFKRGWTVEEQW